MATPPPKKKTRTRDAQRRQKIVEYIRGNIVAGVWPRNGKLPPRTWFESTLDAADHTVQDAFRQLISQGFLIAGRHIGTRVSARPPHLSRYLVLLSGKEGSPNFHTRALIAAVEEMRRRGRDIDMEWDLDREFDDPARLDMQRRVREQLYAGVFLEMPPKTVRSNFFIEAGERTPVTGFFVPEQSAAPLHRPVADAKPQTGRVEAILARFREQGCRRVAALCNTFFPDDAAAAAFREQLARHGLEAPPGFYMETHHGGFAFCQPLLRLLLSRHEEPADALIAFDDNYLPYLNAVLHEFPEAASRLRIAANVNYPALPPMDYPVECFGIDMTATLENGLRFIDRARAGAVPPDPELVLYPAGE